MQAPVEGPQGVQVAVAAWPLWQSDWPAHAIALLASGHTLVHLESERHAAETEVPHHAVAKLNILCMADITACLQTLPGLGYMLCHRNIFHRARNMEIDHICGAWHKTERSHKSTEALSFEMPYDNAGMDERRCHVALTITHDRQIKILGSSALCSVISTHTLEIATLQSSLTPAASVLCLAVCSACSRSACANLPCHCCSSCAI